jgi:alpha-amylase/alpha-mannosidase (GH57 family)
MECFVCIHCHFYQPPRENPWLEAVEAQDSAKPYHDWNERITAECYRPNGASRILDGQGRIAQIVNNYARISFNFGPTLLSWMEEHAPQSYDQVIKADRESQQLFSGHGSAIAQAYNHIILPLANARDKRTQIVWGMRDFQHRFGRDPEGMWLPETGADVETLEALSAEGIKYTILSPYQAGRMRNDSRPGWINLHGQGIDSKRPYWCRLPSGRSIGLFFYDGVVARAVAFDKLLFDGTNLARRLASRFDPQGDSVQLVHIATDGETYGHHHSHGDMALAYALDYVERHKLARITNYGEYFAKHPPSNEVEILDKTSWSCAHGVERWKSNCGCNSMANAHWNQQWRGPLREALDWLRDDLAAPYELHAKQFFHDPWAARDAYISTVADRSTDSFRGFLKEQALRDLSEAEEVHVLRMLEMQRHLMLMYTSCGWFFDEPTGPETVQVFQYAGRAVQLGDALFGGDREEQFLQHLEKVQSNIAEFGNGRRIYERFVRPAMLDLFGAAAHYVISSLFDGYLKRESMYCYAADLYDGQVFTEGKAKLAIGRARITSRITRVQLNFNFAVLYPGDHQLIAGISPTSQGDEFQSFIDYVTNIFSQGDLALCSSTIEHYFGNKTYSLKCLFRDEQQRIIRQLVEASLTDIDEIYRRAHEQHAPQISFLSDLQIPLPSILQALGQFVLGNAVRRCLAEEKTDFEQIHKLLGTAKRDSVNLSESSLNPSLRHRLDSLLRRWRRKPADLATIQALESAVLLAKVPPFNVDLWEAQNQYFELLQAISSTSHFHVDRTWLGHFHKLGEELGVAPLPQSFAAVMAYSVKDEANLATRAHESSRPATKAENRLSRGTQGPQLSM